MGKIQTNSVTGSSVSSLVNAKKVPNTTTTKDTVAVNDKYASKTSDQAIASINTKQASTFVTQSTKQSVVPIKTEADSASKVKNKVNKLSDKELDTISRISRQEIKTDGDLESAMDKISDDLGSMLGNKNTTLTGSPILQQQDVVEKDLTESLDVQSLNIENSNYSKETIEIAQSIDRQYPQLPNISPEVLSSNTEYPNITDTDNNPIEGIPSGTDFNIVENMYKVTQKLCPDTTIPNMINFSFSINLFSGLLSSAAKLGLTDMLQKLIDCVNFYDSLLDDPLKKVTGEVALKGDDKTLTIISSVSGPDVPGKNNKLKDLIKNISNEDTTNTENIMVDWHIGKKEITDKKIYGMDLDIKSTTKFKELSSDKNKGFMKSFFGEDNYALINTISKNL